MTDRLHLTPKQRLVLEALLHKYLPDVEVWAYGSRVNGRSQDGSDFALALMTDEPLSIARGGGVESRLQQIRPTFSRGCRGLAEHVLELSGSNREVFCGVGREGKVWWGG